MARTKHVVSRQASEEIPIEDTSSSGEEMEVPPVQEHSEESSAEETGEEASPRRGKAPEGRVSFQKSINKINRVFETHPSLGSLLAAV